MNRGGRGNSRGGKSQVSYRPKPVHSSPNNQTPILDDVSPGASVSSASAEKSYSSGHAAEKYSGGGMYRNVTPATRQAGGWSTPGSASSVSEGNVGKSTPSSNAVEKSNSSAHAVEKNSGGVIYRNVTPSTSQTGGWSTPGNASCFSEGNLGKSIPSSNAVEKSNSLGHAVEKNSGGVMYRDVTPATRQAGVWSTPCSASSFSEGNVGKSTPSSNAFEKSNSLGHAVEKNSGGVIYRNVTPVTRRGGGGGWGGRGGGRGRGGWSNFGSGSSSTGGNMGQSASSPNASSNDSGFHRDERIGLGSGQLNSSNAVKTLSKGDSDHSSVNLDRALVESLVYPPEAAQLSGEFVPVKTPESTDSLREPEDSECPIEKFDLCPPRKSSGIKLNASLMLMNREKRKEKARMSSGLQGEIKRPGMVLLKNYLSISEQASILKICRDHGLVNVGFYQPQFGEGGKMHLKLMCFGQFWNPETNQYEEVRPTDNSKPPPIPRELLELVDRAVKDSQSLISERERVKNVEFILPSVKPDICLVNYYSKTGRLGLHQDKDESQESLRKGIPIVSFSIGDSADFLYSDQRDADKAEKVELESGDVLIFGGKSRHIFHGVPAIKPDTAPKMLLDETNFRSGRLNLTFRQRC